MQLKRILYSILFFVLFTVAGNAQCAMCRAALETSDAPIKPEGVNDGIVYLMIFPYLLVALVGFAVYRQMKKARQAKKEKEAAGN
ncbi:hypothetical protein GR160_13770 [Flavobacterium sp. Sd200]|uniref:hypothetical protein n=1 Tax=Flavobacterium sp. Sd200 TaxID=2692211 RepID=UPI00136C9938|nr:hypothetical protein [Flavobacterium sp. Sd200]MXN92293.1 hypothetical protein [Flavobacterium sp. Sd200]